MERPYGMHKTAFAAYIRACFVAEINPNGRIMQTIGDAAASGGVHAQDGTLNGQQYCAAVDLRTRDLTRSQVKHLLRRLAECGFACWYRYTGAFTSNEHIHAIYAALPMKVALRRQITDFLNDRDGLRGHGEEKFYTAPPATDAIIRAMFYHANGSHVGVQKA
jgi:hypothetical protein